MFQTKANVYTLFIGSTQLYLLYVFIYFYTFLFISGIRSWTGNSLLQRWRYLPVSDGPVLPSSTRERPCVPEAAIQSHHRRPRGARLVHQWRDVDFQHGLPVPPPPQKKKDWSVMVRPLGPIMTPKDGIMAWTVAHQGVTISPTPLLLPDTVAEMRSWAVCRASQVSRDLTQNTTATATRTSPNKRFDEQNNGRARAL